MVKHSNNSSAVAGDLSVFDHSVELALKGLTVCIKTTRLEEGLTSYKDKKDNWIKIYA